MAMTGQIYLHGERIAILRFERGFKTLADAAKWQRSKLAEMLEGELPVIHASIEIENDFADATPLFVVRVRSLPWSID